MVIVVVFTQKMIKHFKVEKYLCQVVKKTTNTIVCWLNVVDFSLRETSTLKTIKSFEKMVAQLTFQLLMAAQASK